MSDVNIEILKDITDQYMKDMNYLLLQLSNNIVFPTKVYLENLISKKGSIIIIATKNKKIIGTLTLVIINLLSGKKSRIEDVVVDINFRNQGIGTKLIQFAEKICIDRDIQIIDLTSHPKRISANKLYQRLGYIMGETNVYRKYII